MTDVIASSVGGFNVLACSCPPGADTLAALVISLMFALTWLSLWITPTEAASDTIMGVHLTSFFLDLLGGKSLSLHSAQHQIKIKVSVWSPDSIVTEKGGAAFIKSQNLLDLRVSLLEHSFTIVSH